MGCAWVVHGLCTSCARVVHELCTSCARVVHELYHYKPQVTNAGVHSSKVGLLGQPALAVCSYSTMLL